MNRFSPCRDRLVELDNKVQLQNDVLKELLKLLRHKSKQ